jgi:hypothetical protein
VAYHSAGAIANNVSTSNLCTGPKFSNHVIAWTCSGYNLYHYEMKTKFMSNLGW